MITDITITEEKILSDNWYLLKKITYEFAKEDGTRHIHTREVYDRGNGAAILLYNRAQKTVVLTRQFRLPSFVNGNADGMLIEACAGLLDKDDPEACIRREAEEETGYRLQDVRRVYETYMSPGSVTEMLYLFIAEYAPGMKVNEGGGLEQEQENIEVLEMPVAQAMEMIADGRIRDAKTILLLQYLKLHAIL